MNYKDKLISVEQALTKIKSRDIIVTGLGAAEAKAVCSRLHEIADRVEEVHVTNCLPMGSYEFITNPDYGKKIYTDSWFYNADLRKAMKHGTISFIPNHLHLASIKRLSYQKPNLFLGAASMPDRHGYMSLSLSNTYEKRMLEAADMVILEINPNYPRTFGDNEVHLSQVDYLIETDYKPPVIPDAIPNELDQKIGAYVAQYINDGDCIQLGIGGIPNAVAQSLVNKKDLGIHTEMMTTGMMTLAKKGVITGARKNIHRGKIVCTFAMGTEELYDFIDDNPSVLILDGHYVNDPFVIAQNDNQISINTSLEVDLTGQCASESIGITQFSGTGGQADTAIGAQRSRNGKSFITLYSTAMVKEPGSEQRKMVSKIVPFLKAGTAVSLSRNDVDYVVTEYGVAALRGTDLRERAKRLIAIAHPQFREELEKAARELHYIF